MIDYTFTKATKRRDRRGFLVDFLKRDEVQGVDKTLGQIYFVTFEEKHAIRGNHYHTKKKEWFVAVKGKLKVVLEDIKTKERVEFILDGDNDEYERIYVTENIAHAFTNLTETAMMINYCNKPYHKESPDTHKYKLID